MKCALCRRWVWPLMGVRRQGERWHIDCWYAFLFNGGAGPHARQE